MTGTVLVTGGTGTLGAAVTARLRAHGHDHRVLSRIPADGRVAGDLLTGHGVDAALDGTSVVLHLATAPGHDLRATQTLLDAARRAGGPHVVLVSIVGVDRIPLAYYREKLAVERLVAASELPWTVLRATQFHDLLDRLFGTLARTGVLPVLAGTPFQPVDVRDVATRLCDLAWSAPVGRAPDLGGPEVRAMGDLAHAWSRARARRRVVVSVRVPGALADAFRRGEHTCLQQTRGDVTFDEFLSAHAPTTGARVP